MMGGDQENPVLEWIHYDEIVHRSQSHLRDTGRYWTHHKYVRAFGLDGDLEQRCWYTGMQLYFVPWDLHRQLHRKTPWRCSREHLISRRSRKSDLVVPCGQLLNVKLGHIPLALRVLHRTTLRSIEADRDRPTLTNFWPFMGAIIDTQNRLRVDGRYPWQPGTYEPGTRGHRMAVSFMEAMTSLEAEFAALDPRGKRQWIREVGVKGW